MGTCNLSRHLRFGFTLRFYASKVIWLSFDASFIVHVIARACFGSKESLDYDNGLWGQYCLWCKPIIHTICFTVLGDSEVEEPISCNHCNSSISLDDCTKHQKPQKCSVGWGQCGILETPSEDGGSNYLKACFATQTCKEFCAGGHNDVIGIKCKLTCCGNRLCNWKLTAAMIRL